MKMQRWLIILLSLWILPSLTQAKPGVPISLSIEALDEIISGSPVSFKLTAVSRVDADVLHINVKKIAGLELISGALNWRGKVQADKAVSLEFTVILPERGRRINAVAILQGRGGTSFMARAMYRFGKSAELKQQKIQSRHIIRQGQKIVEYPAKIIK